MDDNTLLGLVLRADTAASDKCPVPGAVVHHHLGFTVNVTRGGLTNDPWNS
jgi:hypothetical protein